MPGISFGITSMLMPLLRRHLYINPEVHQQLTIAFNLHAHGVGEGELTYYIPESVAIIEGRATLVRLAMALTYVILNYRIIFR